MKRCATHAEFTKKNEQTERGICIYFCVTFLSNICGNEFIWNFAVQGPRLRTIDHQNNKI